MDRFLGGVRFSVRPTSDKSNCLSEGLAGALGTFARKSSKALRRPFAASAFKSSSVITVALFFRSARAAFTSALISSIDMDAMPAAATRSAIDRSESANGDRDNGGFLVFMVQSLAQVPAHRDASAWIVFANKPSKRQGSDASSHWPLWRARRPA